jgi:sialate O-acetylesterase
MKKSSFILLASLLLTALGSAYTVETTPSLKLPSIIGDHMVLQQKQADPIWGWDIPGTKVTVGFAGQTKTTVAGVDGKWIVKLDPLLANATPQKLTITGSTKIEVQDVLVGEVWLCSGQSNMAFGLKNSWNGDLDALTTHDDSLRFISIPADRGTQEMQTDFPGKWVAATPETAGKFSAVGFLFGRYIQQTLQVPVGMINNAWGGSEITAWIRRSVLDHDPRFQLRLSDAARKEATLLPDNGKAADDKTLADWKAACDKAKMDHKPMPPQPNIPTIHWLQSQKRPGNAFASQLHPLIGYGIKGVLWYQGESDRGCPWDYAPLFNLMITQWRAEWGQGNFPFYWLQLPKFNDGSRTTPFQGGWAEIREAQTKSLALPNTGQAVTIDQGEASNIHPHRKADVAARIARVALAKEYGIKIPYQSPMFKSIIITGNKATLQFDCFDSSLYPYDSAKVLGFAISGEDREWQPAEAKVLGTNTVEVWSDKVPVPVAVRYAWENAPECNLFSKEGLPVTPFRTDAFPLSSPTPTPLPSPQK